MKNNMKSSEIIFEKPIYVYDDQVYLDKETVEEQICHDVFNCVGAIYLKDENSLEVFAACIFGNYNWLKDNVINIYSKCSHLRYIVKNKVMIYKYKPSKQTLDYYELMIRKRNLKSFK